MKRIVANWAAGLAVAMSGGTAMAAPPSYPGVPHVKEDDQSKALQAALKTIGRMYDIYVKKELEIPDGMQLAGKPYDKLDTTITDSDEIHKLGLRFNFDGDELNKVHKIELTGTSEAGEKKYVFYVKHGEEEQVFGVGATRELKDGDKTGEYWTFTNASPDTKNFGSVRFGYIAGGNEDRNKTARITWVRSTSPDQDNNFKIEMRSHDTGWAWHRTTVIAQKEVERLLDREDAKKQEPSANR